MPTTHRGMVSTTERRGALVWGDWRVDLINLAGRPVLRVKNGQYLVGDCATVQEALELLARFGVPTDQLIRER